MGCAAPWLRDFEGCRRRWSSYTVPAGRKRVGGGTEIMVDLRTIELDKFNDQQKIEWFMETGGIAGGNTARRGGQGNFEGCGVYDPELAVDPGLTIVRELLASGSPKISLLHTKRNAWDVKPKI